ncbi:MAG: hypothetical protein A2487_02485 [Candidatus Raymondbacteria bacterium RifOxyC12_full_50_8]|uniref:DUF2225 domain-containing protein n=1 Tax=Candidatus Raymondbacteria bacterium RIFOXYD12_FULL_49_13 TaxID=1817890 RepID=A0A1F7FI23_UNCRA|nr:MAG: hypothetical protein A2248_21025 [Candidatus Raymondbacteria bacterium RIFOXYA2_FULL_49_16]OGJ99544.1 MAG: hypothetical protein A2350_05590 [Candidatus Raymondbacteria bacterium RifOxyB12_full_50_8]OGK06273.1 MAG: hypothetical protein A2519_08340 [Candidatus Raymondbacteria bacterium RIFOXYD12_FULL_49_13]OGK07728.1 MAG: hypothetical protein A2487_02485 [Candidatus Raymondbacteria bacterium RifOxyC12_full_50_8]OGP40605.1 MAG: hypothetical protein A2324_03095 [Candidatus Raymondbacteria b
MPIDVKEVKKRLVFLLKDENLVAEYIRRFGPVIDIKNIRTMKIGAGGDTAESEGEDTGKGEDPVYEITLNCPVCDRQNIISYELKAKSLQQIENRLLQVTYAGAMGHRTLDYDKLAVTVCPRCLFASPDKKDFITINKVINKPVPSQIPPNPILTLQEKIGERRAIMGSVVDFEKFFKRPRNDEAALFSYRLATLRAKVEAFYEMPNSLYKLGAYSLKMAKILKNRKEDDSQTLRDAIEYFKECFKNSNASSNSIEYRIVYSIVALHLKLKEPQKAHPYIGAFERIRTDLKAKQATDPSINITEIETWINKAKYLWEDREREDLFD